MSGVALGAVAGIGFGLFQVVNRRVNAVADVYLATFALMTVSTALLVTISALTEDPGRLRGAPPVALAAFASAGFVHFFLGWTFLGLSQQRLVRPAPARCSDRPRWSARCSPSSSSARR